MSTVETPSRPGYHDDKAAILARLKRIEGQVRGLQRMVADDTYCIDVLTQVSASTKALQSVAVQLVDEHLRHCVAHAIDSGDAVQAELLERSFEPLTFTT